MENLEKNVLFMNDVLVPTERRISVVVLIYITNKAKESVTSKDKLEYINFIILIKIVSSVTQFRFHSIWQSKLNVILKYDLKIMKDK